MPDECPADGLDLNEYYLENRTYFWSLFLLLAISAMVSDLSRRISSGTSVADVARLLLANGNLTLVAISAVLIATKRRWIHAALVHFMLGALVWQWVALTISG